MFSFAVFAGQPKGAMITNRNIAANIAAFRVHFKRVSTVFQTSVGSYTMSSCMPNLRSSVCYSTFKCTVLHSWDVDMIQIAMYYLWHLDYSIVRQW